MAAMDPTAQLMALAAACRPPGRVRWFADAPLAGIAPEPAWRGASTAERLAAAAGVAWFEASRGGVVAVQHEAVSGGSTGEAQALITALGVQIVMIDIGPRASTAPDHVQLWPPVRLRGLRAWISGDQSLAQLAHDEPRLALAADHAPWNTVTMTSACLIALAAYAGEGHRVCVDLPGANLGSWWGALAAIGRRGLPLTLRLSDGQRPPLAWWRSLPGWWLAAPADLGEARAVTARALSSDDAVAIVIPSRPGEWPHGEEHEAGTGRRLRDPAKSVVLLVADGQRIAACVAAAEALATINIEAAVVNATSLHPISAGTLAPYRHLPWVIADAGDADLAEALHHDCSRALAEPTAGEIATAARALLAPR